MEHGEGSVLLLVSQILSFPFDSTRVRIIPCKEHFIHIVSSVITTLKQYFDG